LIVGLWQGLRMSEILLILGVRRCVDGEPVYRRLPDGRVRFSWGVAEQLVESQRRAGADGAERIR
jgi:hypothetical protein